MSSEIPMDAASLLSRWLRDFEAGVTKAGSPEIGALFEEICYWKDILAFTWDFCTYSGKPEITQALTATLARTRPVGFKVSGVRMEPRFQKRSGKQVIDGFFEFETAVGVGNGFVRLSVEDPPAPRALLFLTTLHELHGFEEKMGSRRPTGIEYSKNFTGDNWLDARVKQQRYAGRNPQVLIVGGGQSGLALAARLKQMDVDCLIVERNDRVGDNWRNRYHSLTLHNEVWANSLPYIPFPSTWPTFLPKDKLAGWLEAYAEFMELNVWTGTQFVHGDYDEREGRWSVRLRKADGTERTLDVPHVVLAIGSASGSPYRPQVTGLETFKGQVLHSSEFASGSDYAGQSVVVVGTGNSGHDVAQELISNGASNVTLVQRSPTTVVSLVPGGTLVYAIYSQGPVEDMDLVSLATPLPVLIENSKRLTSHTRDMDSDLLERLRAVGFELDFGHDDTGFYLKYLRRGGGYYINVGCSDLIADGKIDLVNARDLDRFEPEGMRMSDGNLIACDAVVLATGYSNQQRAVERLLGSEVADKIGPVWGLNEHGFVRNMWNRTAQPGLWLMGGSLIDARLNSRFLALLIRADLEGILPERDVAKAHETA